MRTGYRLSLLAGVAILAGAAVAQAPQKVTGPIAVYWMSASTQSGMGMPGMGGGPGGGPGGGRPSMSQIMGMMNGGGGAQKSLTLQLGSTQKPTGAPSAEHLPPQGLGAGPSLPLVTPEAPPPSAPVEDDRPQVPREYQKPRGKMLIFWGCGEHARPGQPIVIDFATMAAGQIPAGMEMLGKGFGFRAMQPPSNRRYATYGEWPNAQGRTSVPSEGSLVGAHTVQGDYSPAIRFNLGAAQDFLGPLTLTTNSKTPGGPAQLGWAPVAGAQAYAATVIGASQEGGGGRGRGGGGGNQDPTVVLWSSSETQAAAFALPDYISPGDLARGVETHALMGPSTTSCLVPKEVVDAAPQGLLQMAAYGGEANFVYPPRPADPKVAWNQQWQVKVRYRSATGGLLGMTMPTMGGGGRGRPGGYPGQPENGDRAQPPPPQTPEEAKAARRRAILQGLGGLIPH